MNTIRIEVEVPADLEVLPGAVSAEGKLYHGGASLWFRRDSNQWSHVVMQQIAAAVEARKPRPPKFAVGDVVEWSEADANLAGVVSEVLSDGAYLVNDGGRYVRELCPSLKLVRRASK